MQNVYIKFTTQTAAERARRVLSSKGIPSALKRNPRPNHKEGCGYALFLSGDPAGALRLLEKEGIAHNGAESLRERT